MFLDKTNGFIKEIVTPASITPDHRMFLISTVYMKAGWTVEAFTSTKHELFCYKKDPIADCAKDFKWIMLNNVNMVSEKSSCRSYGNGIFSIIPKSTPTESRSTFMKFHFLKTKMSF